MNKKTIFRVRFETGERRYSLLARNVRESEFFGFIEISDIIFDDVGRLIVSPEEEALRKEFNGVESISVPHQYIRRIDRLSEGPETGGSYLKIVEPQNQKSEKE